MDDLFALLVQLVQVLLQLVGQLLALGMRWSLLLFWVAWWLWGVNWQKLWGYLAAGAWAPLTLVSIMAALVWSRIAPGRCPVPVLDALPSFWGHLAAVGLLVASALFLGWLQGVLKATPAEISFDPPAPTHDHGHHGHH